MLFKLLAQFLPLEELHVEEIAPTISTISKDDDLWTKTLQLRNEARAKRKKPKQFKRRPPKPMDLRVGINKIIIKAMSDGKPHKAVEFKSLLKEGGYSSNSVGSRLQNLENNGVVIRQGDGTWILGQTMKESA
jgi:hypothetical protein